MMSTNAAPRALAEDLYRDERGDIPGWVMIAAMSAMLVAYLLALAQPLLGELFENAISQVRP
ncbi:hypothetical protein [Nesterenkonia pannonica]|uniref:hypothetical protein n=1 Tax=Nesterenkonia pannonica TaxID=1548602 RepID=UPI002164D068|nr:hypothetical protein [Nesterenkonia pannonica]